MTIVRVFLFSILMSFTLMPAISHAQVNIAVVDVDHILSQSKAAKSIRSQVDDKSKSFLKDVKKEEDKLRADRKKIEGQLKAIGKKDNSKTDEEKKARAKKIEDLINKSKKFDERLLAARKSLGAKKAGLNKAYTKAMNTLTKNIFDVCQSISDERKIDLVITKQNIIVGNKTLDITADVKKELDEKLPTLKLAK